MKPGEYIITDLQGPYVGNINGHKYSQLLRDVKSQKVWVARLRKKTHSNEAIEKIINDSKARFRNNIRILRTDGDGYLGGERH